MRLGYSRNKDGRNELLELGIKENNIYIEGSNKDLEHSRWNEIRNKLTKRDTLVVLDDTDLADSTKALIEMLEFAKEKELIININSSTFVNASKNDGKILLDSMIKVLNMATIIETKSRKRKIKDGLANAKKRKKLGRPKLSSNGVEDYIVSGCQRYLDGMLTVVEVSKLTGKSRSTIYKYISLLQKDGTISPRKSRIVKKEL